MKTSKRSRHRYQRRPALFLGDCEGCHKDGTALINIIVDDDLKAYCLECIGKTVDEDKREAPDT